MNHVHNINQRKRSYEVHALDPAAHAYPGHVVAQSPSYQWHEMDYTSPTMDAPRFAPTSAPVQYAASMMSFSPVDYARHDFSFQSPYSDNDGSASLQAPGLYRIGPLRYSELASLDGDTASISQESMYSRSTRIHSLTDSERRDSQPTSIMSANDMRRESEGFDRMFQMTPIDSESRPGDSHATEQPCLDMANLAPIEECISTPGMGASTHFVVPRPPSKSKGSREQESPMQTTHSGFTSPTTLNFQDSITTDATKVLKPKRMPRSKSAHASIGDSAAIEKATKLRARQAHSLVERKYRDNLNLKISQLHNTLQNTRFGPTGALRSPQKEVKTEYFDEESIMSPEIPNDKSSTGSTPTGPKVRKSDVLTEAMNYVHATETEMRQLSDEVMRLNARLKALEKVARCEECKLLTQMDTLHVERE